MTPTRPSSQPGFVLAVLGPDGSGKSTFSDALVEQALGGHEVLRIHHRPGAVASRTPSGIPVTEPHAGRPYPKLVSLAKLFFLFLDFRIGWWKEIAPFVKRGGWVVWERPWWDVIIDPTRYRLQGSEGAAKILGAALPHPDLVIVLEAPVDVLLARKQEVSEEELIRQTKELRNVVPQSVRTVFLDSQKPIPVLVKLAQTELDKLSAKA